MSKGLRNIESELERENTIQRRLHEKKGGLGYLAALDIYNTREKARIEAERIKRLRDLGLG